MGQGDSTEGRIASTVHGKVRTPHVKGISTSEEMGY